MHHLRPHAICAGALNLLIRHDLTGCPKAALQAAELLGRLADLSGTDREARRLVDTMATRPWTETRARTS